MRAFYSELRIQLTILSVVRDSYSRSGNFDDIF